ncbi:hypothetical protein STCU_12210 [Strigomonas culicis]|uniref:Uncharacterized protein n=1 Tax=Strigomonas culicis TaxID=28005 RepID=S9UKQ4_9TRYP|nr:hypothetical protein STCU_12210 [Strigomonas culicis]|eukprot:EPY15241.1 hypothetical protein STCU_12210 [Strigomonas culicis]
MLLASGDAKGGGGTAVVVPAFEFKTRQERLQEDARMRRAAPAELATEVGEMKGRMRAAVQQRETLTTRERGQASAGAEGGGTAFNSYMSMTSAMNSVVMASAMAPSRAPKRTFPKATRYTNNQK